MSPKELQKLIEADLSKGLMLPQMLLRQFHLFDENARESVICNDPTHFPFYYHLGKYITPKNMVEIGSGLGLHSGCFMASCKTVERFYGVHLVHKENSWRLARSNILLANEHLRFGLPGKFTMSISGFKMVAPKCMEEKWDLVFLNEAMGYDEYRYALDILWESLTPDGYIIVDKICSEDVCRKGFIDLVKSKNREWAELNTIYGSGIIRK